MMLKQCALGFLCAGSVTSSAEPKPNDKTNVQGQKMQGGSQGTPQGPRNQSQGSAGAGAGAGKVKPNTSSPASRFGGTDAGGYEKAK